MNKILYLITMLLCFTLGLAVHNVSAQEAISKMEDITPAYQGYDVVNDIVQLDTSKPMQHAYVVITQYGNYSTLGYRIDENNCLSTQGGYSDSVKICGSFIIQKVI